MPISDEMFVRAFVPHVLSVTTTIIELLRLFRSQPNPYNSYVVIQIDPNTYDVLTVHDLSNATAIYQEALLSMTLASVPGLLRPAAALWQSYIGASAAERAKNQAPRRRVVILNDSGQVVGILVARFLGAPTSTVDPLDLLATAPPLPKGLEPAPERHFSGWFEGHPDYQTPPPERYVNSWFEGHPDYQTPLCYGEEYILAIEMNPEPRVNSLTSNRPQFQEPEFAGRDLLDIIVAIVSDDFAVLGKQAQRMQLPRRGTSPTVTFRVKPVKNNQDVILTVLFYHQNHLFHEAQVRAQAAIGAARPATQPAQYFPVENTYQAELRSARDLNLQVKSLADGYRLIVFYDLGGDQFDIAWCLLPLSHAKLIDLLRGVYADLSAVITMKGTLANGSVGQIFYDGEPAANALREMRLPDLHRVDDTTYQRALELLARVGRKLYINLFQPPSGTSAQKQQAKAVGARLRSLSSRGPLKIQVLSDGFIIPWNLLYDGDYPSPQIEPGAFWGFKHIIEELPYLTILGSESIALAPNEASLSIGMNLNKTFSPNATVSRALIEPQQALVARWLPEEQLAWRFTEQEVLDAMRSGGCRPLEYFYCHAGIGSADEQDIDDSYLGLTDSHTGLTLEEIKLATSDTQLLCHPLFVLNACESANLDGRFYDGFVPMLLSLGACTVIGTDSAVPSLFGAQFGVALFIAMIGDRKSVGEALRELRQRFLDTYHSPVGLIYRLFGHADVYMFASQL